MNKYQLVSLLWLISLMNGQNLVDLKTQTKNVDFSNAAATLPAKAGSTLPATCNVGEQFFKTNNTPGQNLYGCSPANTWTMISGGSSGNVSSANAGQFGYYSTTGAAIVGHTLVAGDIPALNYQAPLLFTGTGTKTVSSTGAYIGNNCAKWDSSGNVIDAGAPCATVTTGTAGQFGFYSVSGTTLAPHTLVAADIPSLNYQSPLTFTGNGAKTTSSTGSVTTNNCAKWDANGNIIDAGSPCASVASGSAGQFGFYSAAGNSLAPHTLVAADIPALNYQTPLIFTGNGAKVVSSTGAITVNNCLKWDANGNVADAGAPCGSGGGGVTTPSSTTVGNVPQFSTTTGSALSVGLGVVTTVGSPGSDSAIPTEKSVRTAIAAASGSLPAQTGNAGYLVSNGSSYSLGNIATGGSGALDCATIPGVCDVATAVVPLKATANTWTGANDFSGASFLRLAGGTGVPSSGCALSSDVGKVYTRNDAKVSGASLYICSQTGNGTYSWEFSQGAGPGMPVYNAAGTVLAAHMVTGRASLSSSTTTVSFSGAAAFSSSSSYNCTANDLSNVTAVSVTQSSGSSATFTIQGGASGDTIGYVCVGN